jgi:hypothetical protein
MDKGNVGTVAIGPGPEGKNIKYVEDLGLPWTKDKAMCECKWCFKGTGVFGDLNRMMTEPVVYVHPWCMKEIEANECEVSFG